MVVHIAPIGRETKHVEEWLREITPVTKVWLIHSKRKDGATDYSKNAKDLEKKLSSTENFSDYEKLNSLSEEYENLNNQIDSLEESWLLEAE